MLSGMGADELFAGYRKHLANLLAAALPARSRAPLRAAGHAAVDRLPVASARRGYRSVRFAKRFLSFADLPEETAFRRSYTMYDRAELLALLNPDLAGDGRRRADRARATPTTTTTLDRLRQPHVPGATPGCSCRASTSPTPTGPAWPRRPRCACRSSTSRWSRRRSRSRRPQDRRPAGQGRPQGGGAVDPAAGDRVPAQGPVQRAAAGLDEPRPGAAGARGRQRRRARRRPGSCAATRWRGWSPRTPRAARTSSKHLWHVLTLEYWYRGATAADRTRPRGVETEDFVKQVVQNYKSGELALLDVPVPACKPGGVLVRSAVLADLHRHRDDEGHEAGMSMVGKARARPDQVRQGHAERGRQQGAVATYRKVMNKLDSYTPLGYSLCGVVVEVGAGVDDVAGRRPRRPARATSTPCTPS